MKKYISIFLLLILASCSGVKHIQKAEQHIAKAKAKGVFISAAAIVTPDTIEKIYTQNDTIYKERIITITTEPQIFYKDRWQVKVEAKVAKVEAKEETKQVNSENKKETKVAQAEGKAEAKVAKAENKKNKWWIWLLIGVGAGFFLPKIIMLILKR